MYGPSNFDIAMTRMNVLFLVLVLVPAANYGPAVWQPMVGDLLPDLLYANRAGLLGIDEICRLQDLHRFWVWRWLRTFSIRVHSQYYYVLCFRKTSYSYVHLGMLRLLLGISEVFQDCFNDASKGCFWLRTWRIGVHSQNFHVLCFRMTSYSFFHLGILRFILGICASYSYVTLGMLFLAEVFLDCFFDSTKGYPGEGPAKRKPQAPQLTAAELQARHGDILSQRS